MRLFGRNDIVCAILERKLSQMLFRLCQIINYFGTEIIRPKVFFYCRNKAKLSRVKVKSVEIRPPFASLPPPKMVKTSTLTKPLCAKGTGVIFDYVPWTVSQILLQIALIVVLAVAATARPGDKAEKVNFYIYICHCTHTPTVYICFFVINESNPLSSLSSPAISLRRARACLLRLNKYTGG